jgi:hypothetical protein
MKLFIIGLTLGGILTAGATTAFESGMWRFGTEATANEKLDQIQHQHRLILEQQDRLERVFQQACIR